MQNTTLIDQGRTADWGKTSEDYARYRPGPPLSLYEKLQALGVGLKEQKILDLATGTGLLARQFAKQGATVCAIDISAEQIKMAQLLAEKEGLKIDFKVAPAENIPYPDNSFDIMTANQCWLYFDKPKTIAEARRLLVQNGLLITSHFSWMPRLDAVAKQSEELILKYNPQWNGNDDSGEYPSVPEWSKQDFNLRAMFYYDEAIPFSRESWRGRIRASRGISASLSEEEVAAFDREHDELLKKITTESFTVIHRIDARIFQFK